MPKVKKLTVAIPMCIVLLSGKTYYNSQNGDYINVDNLEQYVAAKYPAASLQRISNVTHHKPDNEIKDELIREKRWDLKL